MPRPREITTAAVVAFLGSGLFLSSGVLLGVSLNHLLQSLFEKYPGLDIDRSADSAVPLLKNILFSISFISVVLGGLGAITAIGLLRMRQWARRSVILWCIVSTLACLLGLVYPGPRSEFRISPTPILVLMLFVFPINAWWLLLFFRVEIKAQFAPLGSVPGNSQWQLRRLLMPKWIIVAVIVVLLAAGLGWTYWRNAPMREIERARASVAAKNTWHYHTVKWNRVDPHLPPDAFDVDTTCPSFQHSIQSGTDRNGARAVFDSINYFGRVYNHVGDQWMLARGAQGSIPIFECIKSSIGNDENSLPFDGIVADGAVQRGALGEVAGESCRYYDIAVPTPHDTAEKEFRFTMCINEQDHLPRETRRTPPGFAQEGVSTYTQWNSLARPQLPSDFHE